VRTFFRRLVSSLGWTQHSAYLLAAFLLVSGCILYFWWPLAQQVVAAGNWHGSWWESIDWLLLVIFLFMTLLILVRADLRTDLWIILVASVGGLVIEAWGTQTNLWFYFTAERPPLWILPAWPIATLSIDRLTRFLNWGVDKITLRATAIPTPTPAISKAFRIIYWITYSGFFALMLVFVAPTLGKSMTLAALLLVMVLILTPTDYRKAVLIFAAGTGLGYFLELWGTTRQCWTYYTYQTPPAFAVLAHGMAAVTFWRVGLLLNWISRKISTLFSRGHNSTASQPKY
jgi:hypothetical protein